MKDDGCDEYSLKICQTPPKIIFDPENIGLKNIFWPKGILDPEMLFYMKNSFDLNSIL